MLLLCIEPIVCWMRTWLFFDEQRVNLASCLFRLVTEVQPQTRTVHVRAKTVLTWCDVIPVDFNEIVAIYSCLFMIKPCRRIDIIVSWVWVSYRIKVRKRCLNLGVGKKNFLILITGSNRRLYSVIAVWYTFTNCMHQLMLDYSQFPTARHVQEDLLFTTYSSNVRRAPTNTT